MARSSAGRLLVVAYTPRGEVIRLISAREATRGERKRYEEEDYDLLPEYDFSKMRLVARGPGRQTPQAELVHLAPDVA